MRRQSDLTSSAAGSLARTSAPPERMTGSKERGQDFGRSSLAWFAFYDHALSSWKTRQLSFLEDSTASSLIWPRSGSMRNGLVFARPTSERLTPVNESSFLPTPTRSMAKHGWGVRQNTKHRYSAAVKRNALAYGWFPPRKLVEALMGLPDGWTSPLWATPASRSKRR